MILWTLLCLLALTATCRGLGCYGDCECHPHAGLITCAGRDLRLVPNFGSDAAEAYPELDLRNNLIKEVDLTNLKDFKVVHLTENLLDCYDGVLNLDLRKYFKITTDCDSIWDALADLKKGKGKGAKRNSKTSETQAVSSGEGAVNGNSHGHAKAEASAKGEMKVQWAFSMTMTVFGGISGTVSLVAFYKLRKTLKKLIKRLADQGIDKNSDDEAAEEEERADRERTQPKIGFRRRPAPPPPRPSVFKRFLKRWNRDAKKKPTDDVILDGEVPPNLNQWMADVNHRVATTNEHLSSLTQKIDGLTLKTNPIIAPARLSPASTYRARYGPFREPPPQTTDSSDSAEVENALL